MEGGRRMNKDSLIAAIVQAFREQGLLEEEE
jgi:hypothetical protein